MQGSGGEGTVGPSVNAAVVILVMEKFSEQQQKHWRDKCVNDVRSSVEEVTQ